MGRRAQALVTSAPPPETWLAVATSPSVVRRALLMSAIVGALLVSINHGDALLRGELDATRLLKMALTLLVPYCVSTYSSVGALRGSRAQGRKT